MWIEIGLNCYRWIIVVDRFDICVIVDDGAFTECTLSFFMLMIDEYIHDFLNLLVYDISYYFFAKCCNSGYVRKKWLCGKINLIYNGLSWKVTLISSSVKELATVRGKEVLHWFPHWLKVCCFSKFQVHQNFYCLIHLTT